jgi:hypothetical protein
VKGVWLKVFWNRATYTNKYESELQADGAEARTVRFVQGEADEKIVAADQNEARDE